MAVEMISMKLEDKFLKEIDSVVEKSNFQNRTEFIRQALREKVDRIKYEEARASIIHLLGAHKGKKTTDAELHKIRELAFRELTKND
jgi:metal-responsive CopG/Arc/MetJ family transcriptional regulator